MSAPGVDVVAILYVEKRWVSDGIRPVRSDERFLWAALSMFPSMKVCQIQILFLTKSIVPPLNMVGSRLSHTMSMQGDSTVWKMTRIDSYSIRPKSTLLCHVLFPKNMSRTWRGSWLTIPFPFLYCSNVFLRCPLVRILTSAMLVLLSVSCSAAAANNTTHCVYYTIIVGIDDPAVLSKHCTHYCCCQPVFRFHWNYQLDFLW